jgi:hypothetical protein
MPARTRLFTRHPGKPHNGGGHRRPWTDTGTDPFDYGQDNWEFIDSCSELEWATCAPAARK